MKYSSNDNTVLTLLKVLRLLCVGVILVPVAVLFAGGVSLAINSTVGWQKYPLPGLFLFIYLLAAAASPVVGIVSLVVLFIKRRAYHVEFSPEGLRIKKHVLILSAVNVLAVVVWVVLFPVVFFSAGGSR